jgi:hypothetical protein
MLCSLFWKQSPELSGRVTTPLFWHTEEVEFVEELQCLGEGVEGGGGPAPEQEEGVLVDHQAGAGLRAGVGPHGQRPAEKRDSKKEKKLTVTIVPDPEVFFGPPASGSVIICSDPNPNPSFSKQKKITKNYDFNCFVTS